MHKTILIMAGGTGGHVFPGIAVADFLTQESWQVHWLGTSQRMEADIVPNAGYDISFVDVVGVRGNGLVRKLKAPFQLVKSVLQARRVLDKVRPDVVLGMGGFASGPGGIAAWLKGIPLVVHEQNALPGLTNKILAKLARRVLMGFQNAFGEQHKTSDKYAWVGNPVRPEFAASPKACDEATVNVLVVGGSLGASVLNQNVAKELSGLTTLNVWHQCGKGNKPEVLAQYTQHWAQNDNVRVNEFIDDMASAYHWADIIVCRAGALTVSEVAMAAKPAIFVPLPHAVDDHQTFNAKALSDNGAGVLLPQSTLANGGLFSAVKALVSDQSMRKVISEKAHALAKADATERVARVCENLAMGAK